MCPSAPVNYFNRVGHIVDRLGVVDSLFVECGTSLEVCYTYDNANPPGLKYCAILTLESYLNRGMLRTIKSKLQKELGKSFTLFWEDYRVRIEYRPKQIIQDP